MNHLGTKTLETRRLVLRKFKREDAESMFKNYANDDDVTKYMTWPSHESVLDSSKYIDFLINNYKEIDNYNWGIELKDIKEIIGAISVVHYNKDTNNMHIGYCIGKRWWNKGITSEAFEEIIKFLFEEVGCNKIESRHDPRNENSGKVMMKCGLRYEGTLRMSDVNNLAICDAAYYGLLRDEYLSLKK